METYTKVRDVLQTAQQFHSRLQAAYDKLSDETGKKRLQILLDYMSGHEEQFKEGLADYRREGAEDLLDTWIQYAPDEEHLGLPSVDQFDPAMDIADIEKKALEFDDRLMAFYSDAARHAKTERVREMFEDLARRHETDKAELKKTILMTERGM